MLLTSSTLRWAKDSMSKADVLQPPQHAHILLDQLAHRVHVSAVDSWISHPTS